MYTGMATMMTSNVGIQAHWVPSPNVTSQRPKANAISVKSVDPWYHTVEYQ